MNSDWSLKKNVYTADLSVDEMTNAINVFEILKIKYPNDENIELAIEILRNEICMLYGGSIYYNEE